MAKRPSAPRTRVRPAPKRAASAEPERKRKPLRGFGSNPDAPYHHGALLDALLQAADIARAWSLVHGFTTLLLDGRLTDIIGRLPKDTSAEALLDAMLKRAGHVPVT